jgi:coenzyme F420-reducing hydrogenase delta subunit/Pyruvate/2-oxoacid:ferredoxin oxidoreductase delta subunit
MPDQAEQTPSNAQPNVLRIDGLDTPRHTAIAGGRVEPDRDEMEEPTGLLRGLGKIFLYIDRLFARIVKEPLNPMFHTGAITVASTLIATVTGVVLLIWYKPSVHYAYESVQAMSQSPYTAGLLRSLHRYSSDAAMFFGLLHATRIFFERRFGGARWLAWVTGAALMALILLVGWTGYWLVWDARAQAVALGTAKLMDVLPIFVEPLSRSFITDEGVNSLLFFVIFFVHMLLPLGLGVAAWLHITRLARPRFLTARPMSLWLAGVLLLLCVFYPATNEVPAVMTALPRDLTMDWWFLFPLVAIDRLSGGQAWAFMLVASAAFISVPWWLARRRPAPAVVVETRCNECRKCYTDCPYNAIEMIARTDGNEKHQTQASVISSKCVSCGICTGSCDTAGIGVDWLSSIDERKRITSWLGQAESDGEKVQIAFACAESAAAGLEVDAATGRCDELPGYRVLQVPCAGWVHPLMIERAMRNGAEGVMIVSCGPGECAYRDGSEWTEMRLEGTREPALRPEKVDREKVLLLGLDRTRKAELLTEAARHRAEGATATGGGGGDGPGIFGIAAAALLAVVFAVAIGAASDLVYAAPRHAGSELAVSLKHPGVANEECHDISEEELAATPVHMRKPRECKRTRPSVRLRVEIDGELTLDTSIVPSGLWKDGNSVALERVSLEPGDHHVSVAIGETADPDEWTFRAEKTLTFTDEARRVVVFDRVAGFTWH